MKSPNSIPMVNEDGDYEWYYDIDLMRDTHILFLVLKTTCAALVMAAIIIAIVSLAFDRSTATALRLLLELMPVLTVITVAVTLIGYALFVRYTNRKCSLRMLMSEDSITVQYLPFESTSYEENERVVSPIDTISIPYDTVTSAVTNKQNCTIALWQTMRRTTIYTSVNHYDFVRMFIMTRIKKGTP